jgi:hypothetical protein
MAPRATEDRRICSETVSSWICILYLKEAGKYFFFGYNFSSKFQFQFSNGFHLRAFILDLSSIDSPNLYTFSGPTIVQEVWGVAFGIAHGRSTCERVDAEFFAVLLFVLSSGKKTIHIIN